MKKKMFLGMMLVLTTLLVASQFGIAAFADFQVYVTISDGALRLANEPITVTDVDGDMQITINDALELAHKDAFPNGDGYLSEQTDYGLSMYKLWGVENGDSYGYYLNNASAMSLLDPISEGDYISAYAYTDLTSWSDTYCYFDSAKINAKVGEEIVLTLNSAGYDENWNPITLPVEGAEIIIDGNLAGIKTDASGKAVITVYKAGTYTISAKSDTAILVPPVATAVIEETAPQTSDAVIMAVSGLLLGAGVFTAASKKFRAK